MKEYLEIRIPAKPKMMSLVRKTIAHACELVGFSSRDVCAVTLAVDEGCTNIIRHSYGECSDGQIIIRIRMFPDKIVILLRDFGSGIDLKKLQEKLRKRKLEIEKEKPMKPGGLGVMLIHSTMDKVQYKTSRKSGTVLRLVKYLSSDKGEKIAGKS